jgi:hypothetical protein
MPYHTRVTALLQAMEIASAVGLGQETVRGGRDHDRAAGPGGRHHPGEPAADQERAREVDAQDDAPFLVGDVQERAPPPDPGVGHHDVDAAEPLQGAGDQLVDRLRVGDVGGEGQDRQ